MKIDEFPAEILVKIFNYLPSYNEVSLVNKRFYVIASDLWDPTICLRLDWSLFKWKKNIKILQSIKNTKRNITKVELICYGDRHLMYWKSMMDIIGKFSATIKYLKFAGCIELSEFFEMVNLVPNAEHLELRFNSNENQPLRKKRRVLNRTDLNLHQLKKLKLEGCNDEFMAVFNRLPDGVLTELELDYLRLNEMNEMFKRQTAIKKLTIYWFRENPYAPSANLLENQQLDYLKWHFNSNCHKNIDIILSTQTKLKALKLNDSKVRENILNVVTNQLTELDTLFLYTSATTIAAFKNISKLKNLKKLELMAADQPYDRPFEEFAKQDNSRITHLKIGATMYKFPVDLIAALAKSFCNVKSLRIGGDYDFEMYNAIMLNFNFVNSLRIDSFFGNYFNENDENVFYRDNCKNPNLVELEIFTALPYKTIFLEKLIEDYPNLKKLVIKSMKPFTLSQFKLILNGFEKLESLRLLAGAYKLSVEDLECLMEHRNRLKFISLDVVDMKPSVRLKKRLTKMFDVVKLEYRNIKMAVNTITMKSEE